MNLLCSVFVAEASNPTGLKQLEEAHSDMAGLTRVALLAHFFLPGHESVRRPLSRDSLPTTEYFDVSL